MKVKRILAGVTSGLMSVCSLIQAFPLAAECADTTYTANGGYTAGEIEAAEIKPHASLSKIVIPSSYAGTTQNVTLSIEGADKKWASAFISVYYDKRLELVKNDFGDPSCRKGNASQYLNIMHVKEDNDSAVLGNDWGGLAVTCSSVSDNGLDGDIVTIDFVVPKDAKPGDVFPFDIAYKSTPNGHSLFTNSANNETGKLMQAYLFTKGIYDPVYNSNFAASEEDIARVPDLAKIDSGFDGYIAIEDDPHLIVTSDSANQKTTVSWDNNSSGASLFLKVTDSKGNTVFSEDSSDASVSFDVSLTAGTYTAALTDFSNNVFDSFEFRVGDTGKWSYCSKLPTYITPDKADIQYRQTASKVSSTSPGEGWQKGELVKSDYENSGSPYESDIELPTSETRQLLSYYYYHFCPSSGENRANYTQTDYFTHWDALSADSVYVVQSGPDEENPSFKYYYLKWNGTDIWAYCESGTTCDGSYGSHGARSYVWYRRSTYQDRVLVNYYNYTKDSGTWTSTYDPSASLISYRFSVTEPAVPETTTAPVTTKAAPPTTTTAATTTAKPVPLTTKAVPTTTKAEPTTTKTVPTTSKPITTTLPTTAVPIVTTVAKFEWGRDNWNFNNSSYNGYFRQSAYSKHITEPYLSVLKRNLRDDEYTCVFKGYWYDGDWYEPWIEEEFGGSCYGMSSLLLLNLKGLINHSAFTPGASALHDHTYPINNMDVSSLITYYQMIQVKEETQNIYRRTKIRSKEESIKEIISLLNDNPVVIIGIQKSGWGGHAIIAYDVEYGSYTKNGVTYQGRIRICDPNSSVKQNNDYDFYFNTSSYNWVIPAYYSKGVYSANGAIINYVGADASVINYGGYLSGISSTNTSDQYIASIEIAAASNNRSLNKLDRLNNRIMNQSGDDIVEDEIYNFRESDSNVPIAGYLLKDSNASYILKQNNAEKLQLTMKYENSTFNVSSAAGKEVVFDKKGYVSVSGETANYSIGMLLNDDHPTDWFFVGVSGEGADKAEMEKVENGYILKADNLNNVKVEALNRNVDISTRFSTDYNKALIYEIDEETIGIAIDTDDDGTYETAVETASASGSPGDINGDGVVDSSDASEVLMLYAQVSTGGDDVSDETKAIADINGDGLVDSSDASLILEYYAYVSTGGTDTADVYFSKEQKTA